MDSLDRRIINCLQGGFPISPRPYAEVAERLGLTEDLLIDRIEALLERGILSRFGPLFDAERLGGAVTLAAMAVPEARFEAVTEIVNGFTEVAHNYRRDHALNMWFVVASDEAARIAQVLSQIEATTGLAVLDLPKEEEYFLALRLSA